MAVANDKRLGFSAVGGRDKKARKIMAVLASAGKPLQPDLDVLDLGCGSGELASVLSKYAEVTCADVRDQRVSGLDLPFTATANLPAVKTAAFDVIISNHVIEHVPDPIDHLAQIHRLLKPDGVAYLATPNRYWPVDPHTGLAILHYLPPRWFETVARRAGRLHEPLRLVSPAMLTRWTRDRFISDFWHHRVLSNPDDFSLSLPSWARTLTAHAPAWLLNGSRFLQPTLICLLYPR